MYSIHNAACAQQIDSSQSIYFKLLGYVLFCKGCDAENKLYNAPDDGTMGELI